MKITVVADVFGQTNNGTSATASRLVENMKKRGHEVKVVSTYKCDDKNYYTVPERNFLFFNNYIKKINGVALGKPKKSTIAEAIEGADVVHFLLPFKMSKCGIKICIEKGIPFTTAFHCQPENVTSHISLQNVKWLTRWLYKHFKSKFYKKCLYIHCPSQFIADKLVENGYKTKNFVISNGVREEFRPTPSEKPEELKDKICIMLSGRYSNEKRQDVLLKAVNLSKYRDKIQVILAGNGPLRDKIEKLGEKLPIKPIMCFLSKEELISTINYCDLYVHASDIEIEGIGCMEAISCGIVPVLSNSKNAALYQFTLSENNLFEAGNEKDLAEKIDWWIEHPEEKAEMSKKYVEFMEQFKIERCMDKMEEMFKYAIEHNGDKND
ncbi:MAG: glycosyltransferase [Clostridia bacterium]|nr:glycosyltransferase [Clostridia bacterium]